MQNTLKISNNHLQSLAYEQSIQPYRQLYIIDNKIYNQLVQGGTTLSNNSSVPIIRYSNEQNKTEENKRQIQKLNLSKIKTLTALQQIKQREKELRRNLFVDRNSQRSNCRILTKSQHTKAQQFKIKSILKSMEQLKQSQQFKDKEVELLQKNTIKLDKQNHQQHIIKMKQQNRELAIQKLAKLQQRKKQRRQFQSQVKEHSNELKDRFYIYQQKEKIDEKRNQYQKQERQHKLNKLKEKFRFDLQSVLHHERKYRQQRRKNLQQLEFKKMYRESLIPSTKKYQKNRFAQTIQTQHLIAKQKQREKLQRKFNYRTRIKTYTEAIDRHNKSEMKNYQPLEPSPQHSDIREPLNLSQRKYKGNLYLRAAIQSINRNKMKPSKSQTKSSVFQEHSEQEEKSSHRKIQRVDHRKRFKQLLKKSKQNPEDKQMIKQLTRQAQKITQFSRENPHQREISEMKRKLQILSVIL